MNQLCKVCGEAAAGFHFGAFTCEGCKSFFGRSYNNLPTITDCKNGGQCEINKKTRTSCKACRLRKCLDMGMSKSGSRYGRRSNWFKIHCLLQSQSAARGEQMSEDLAHSPPPTLLDLHSGGLGGGSHLPDLHNGGAIAGSRLHRLFESPSTSSSPESLPSDTSLEAAEHLRFPLRPHDLFNPYLHMLMGVSPPPPPPHLMAQHLAAALAQRTLYQGAWPVERPDTIKESDHEEVEEPEEAIDLSVKGVKRREEVLKKKVELKKEEEEVDVTDEALTPPGTPLDLSRVEV